MEKAQHFGGNYFTEGITDGCDMCNTLQTHTLCSNHRVMSRGGYDTVNEL